MWCVARVTCLVIVIRKDREYMSIHCRPTLVPNIVILEKEAFVSERVSFSFANRKRDTLRPVLTKGRPPTLVTPKKRI